MKRILSAVLCLVLVLAIAAVAPKAAAADKTY